MKDESWPAPDPSATTENGSFDARRDGARQLYTWRELCTRLQSQVTIGGQEHPLLRPVLRILRVVLVAQPPALCLQKDNSCVSMWNAGCRRLHLRALVGSNQTVWADGPAPAAPQNAVMNEKIELKDGKTEFEDYDFKAKTLKGTRLGRARHGHRVTRPGICKMAAKRLFNVGLQRNTRSD